ncbi:MAG: hypothetical protein HY525_20490 [Betaproteobacteria bacterium]|nr:hypothetical protein [Betaproteobacteria bacterium]
MEKMKDSQGWEIAALRIASNIVSMITTGKPAREAVAALWRDIDLDGGVGTIRETKNGDLPHFELPVRPPRVLPNGS